MRWPCRERRRGQRSERRGFGACCACCTKKRQPPPAAAARHYSPTTLAAPRKLLGSAWDIFCCLQHKNSTRTGWDLFCCFQQLQVRHDTSDMWGPQGLHPPMHPLPSPGAHRGLGSGEAGSAAAVGEGGAGTRGSRTGCRLAHPLAPDLATRQALMTNPKAVDGCTHWSRSGGRRSRRRSPQPGRTWRIGGTWSGFRERARGWASGGGKGQPPPGQAARAALALAARRRPSAAPHGPVGAPRASPER